MSQNISENVPSGGSSFSHGVFQSGALENALQKARILVVDDEPANVLLLRRILRNAGYENVAGAGNGAEALKNCLEAAPDLILLDLMMPQRDGFGVLEDLAALRSEQFLPVLVLTADINPEAMRRALGVGATDFLTKPFDHVGVVLRVKNLLQTRVLTLQLRDHNATLEARVAQRTQELSDSYQKLVEAHEHVQQSQRVIRDSQIETLQRLAQAAELRDDDTGQHTQRVAGLAARLAQRLGLDPEAVELIRRASPLHDVGKIGVSDTILLKPGKLTPAEFETMKNHVEIGAALMKDGQSPLMRAAEIIARTHHERYDGLGYPCGLKGEEIPFEGRILAVVDVFDALTHERPYKSAWPVEKALEEIENGSGTQFDPRVAREFVAMIREEDL